ncbi:MAG: hypothetical protein O3C27_17195 [Actinomycetota bacterium]|nr:hypothetical protein [Actinomycetota bacterium]
MNHFLHARSAPTGPVSIDCDACVRQDTDTCSDCVVTFLIGRQPSEAVVIDVAEFAALRRLQTAGLVPELRHQVATR